MADPDRLREDGQLRVRVQQEGKALVVSAFGELDTSNLKTLEAELRLAIDGYASKVVLDLGGVHFIDSAGLRVLLLMASHSLVNGDCLRLLRGSAVVDRAIEWGVVDGSLPFDD